MNEPDDITYFSKSNPDLMHAIKNLTFAQIKAIKEKQKKKTKQPSYVSVINGRRNTFQYS